MKWIHGVAANDNAVKLVFDHVRNLGICAAVFAAAWWKIQHSEQSLRYLEWGIAGVLIVLGIWLFMVNQAHALRKLREHGISRNVVLALGNLYSLAAVTLIASIIVR